MTTGQEAIEIYISEEGFLPINAHLRGIWDESKVEGSQFEDWAEWEGVTSKEFASELSNLLYDVVEAGIAQSDMILYRRMDSRFFEINEKGFFIEKGFASASYADLGESYGDLLLEIHVKAGTTGVLDVEDAGYETEEEVLLQNWSKFKVIEIENGKAIVELA